MKARLIAMLSGLGVLLGLSGCLEIDEVLTLKKDGSGTITSEVVMGAQIVAMMEMGAAQGGGGPNPMAEMFDEAQYKKKAASYGEGVEYVKLEKVERNGGKGVKAHYKFADINKVVFAPGSAMEEMGNNMGPPGAAPKQDDKSQPLKFSYAGGKLTITFPDPPEGEKPEIPDEGANPQMAQMAAMFKDMKMGAKLVVEPGIASTNATHVEGNTITLMDINFGKILENPDGMKVLNKLDMKDRKKMEAALKGVKGVKLETKKTVDVKVK